MLFVNIKLKYIHCKTIQSFINGKDDYYMNTNCIK